MCVFSQAVVLEGKYQKRKVEAVAREYRKWRMFHREKFVKYFLTIIYLTLLSLSLCFSQRQGGSKTDPLLADLVENLRGVSTTMSVVV